MSHENPIHTLLEGLERPAPPADLEARTLAVAARALGEPPAPDLWERAWSSPTLRLAWATCLLALVGGHVMVSVHQGVNRVPGSSPVALRQSLGPELARIADLPAIALSTIAWEPVPAIASTSATASPTRKEIRQ